MNCSKTGSIPPSCRAGVPAQAPDRSPGTESRRLKFWMAVAVLASSMVVGCEPSEPGGTKTPAPSAGDEKTKDKGDGTATSGTDGRFQFVDRTAESGVAFQYQNGEESGYFSILESLGGGLAPIDFDRDGFDDVCLAGGGKYRDKEILPAPTGLFRRTADWKWMDVSSTSGVTSNSFYSHGIARTDFDGDGFPDFLVTGYGGIELFHNQGDGTFRKLDSSCGLTDSKWSSSAAWGDLNGDQIPDLYVAHYVNWSWENDPFCKGGPENGREICPPRSYEGLKDVLYLSRGDGTFEDATVSMGLSEAGKGLGVLLSDIDLDGDNDIYVTNDTVSNFLYENTGTGTLNDVSVTSGACLSASGVPDGSMGVELFDYNLDERPDLWVVNYERETNALYQSSGNLIFRHVSQRVGISAIGGMYVGWGTVAQDFDRDGDEDVFVSNGHVIRYPQDAPLNQVPLMLENQNGKRFQNLAESTGPWFRQPHMGRGAITSDFDLDGDMDLAVQHTNQPAIMLANNSPAEKDWIAIRLIGNTSSREPVGAIVRTKGDRPQMRLVKGGGSFGSSQPEYFLIAADAGADAVTVNIQWPSGKSDTGISIPVKRHATIVEGPADAASRVIAEFK
ncbi:MAG: VCBS repeat-containing protein [Planctomycetaceae bacterium]|nr:VCBS repeat-containing protein [Planctomycetaceae bacterium]